MQRKKLHWNICILSKITANEAFIKLLLKNYFVMGGATKSSLLQVADALATSLPHKRSQWFRASTIE